MAFVYKQSSLQYEWKGYGIELLFESHSLPSDISERIISISVVSSMECLLPENVHLVSGLFQIDCQGKFDKPVTIKIQHCAVKRKLIDLCFVTSSDENSPYKCQCVEGDFDSNFGEIKVSSFSVYGIIMRPIVSLYETIRNVLWPVTSGLLYSIYLYYNFSEKQPCWNLTFIVVKNLDIYLTYVEEFARRNNTEKSVVHVVEFDESEEIHFKACLDETQDVRLCHKTTPFLRKHIVNKCEQGNLPTYELQLTSSKRLTGLSIKFCIEGIRHSHEYFITFVWNSLGKSIM